MWQNVLVGAWVIFALAGILAVIILGYIFAAWLYSLGLWPIATLVLMAMCLVLPVGSAISRAFWGWVRRS